MERTVMIDGCEVVFRTCSAICDEFPEEGRRNAIYVHQTDDVYGEGDGVIFDADLPEDEEGALALLTNEYLNTYSETLDTVEF